MPDSSGERAAVRTAASNFGRAISSFTVVMLSSTALTTSAFAQDKVPADPGAPLTSAPQAARGGDQPARPNDQSNGPDIVITAAKTRGDVQSLPVAITAVTQKQLTELQIAGGPDLIRAVPNVTFSKTNFSSYNIQIRGIGTQAISVATDPAVAVAMNDVPFLRNHFFEQEFYDVDQVSILSGPQGTLYGRNATAGVVNVVTAKPTDKWEAMGSVDVSNYGGRRLEGMINVPIWGDKLDLRVAGEWTKRDGFTYNSAADRQTDGRDLWSGRVSLKFQPASWITANFVWEHFHENDDRLRSGKQLCTTDNPPTVVGGVALDPHYAQNLTQGCKMGSLYDKSAFGTPNAAANPFIGALASDWGLFFLPNYFGNPKDGFSFGFDPYTGQVQSTDPRTISSDIPSSYRTNNNVFQANIDFKLGGGLTLSSQTAYSKDTLYSSEDYNRFASNSNIFSPNTSFIGADGQFCDPQLGCSTKLIGEDVSEAKSKQFYQEVRLASNFSGPVNFTVGGNYMNYKTTENYYVFYNALTYLQEMINAGNYGGWPYRPGFNFGEPSPVPPGGAHVAFNGMMANACNPQQADQNLLGRVAQAPIGCAYIDPNTLGSIDGQGHNYFRSQNPYKLTSYAAFGEVNYKATPSLTLTAGLRYTDDKKRFVDIPSWAALPGKGFVSANPVLLAADPGIYDSATYSTIYSDPTNGVIRQEWKEFTGRFNVAWTPNLGFTDRTLLYFNYSHGYKGGGANPPGVMPTPPALAEDNTLIFFQSNTNLTHPLTFKPEFVDSFEVGTKNTLLNGALTVNGAAFYYKYKGYQISEIVDRAAINKNYDADVWGAEATIHWQATRGLSFDVKGGYTGTRVKDGQSEIDLMDRTAGSPDWQVAKSFFTGTSNCIGPVSYIAKNNPGTSFGRDLCSAITAGIVDQKQSILTPEQALLSNNGQGIAKNLGGKKLPNVPPFTVSVGAQYTMNISNNWQAKLHADYYAQGNSFARVFNDKPYDQLRGMSMANVDVTFRTADDLEIMFYVKNLFNKTAITGAFLNSDDTSLTTNVFLTDPRLYGMRITKKF